MGTINFDGLAAPVERKVATVKGAKFNLDSIHPRIVKDVEELLVENTTLLSHGKATKYVDQECGSAEAAQEWLRQMDKYALYRPADRGGQITVRVPNRKAVKAGEATVVSYAAKPLEIRTPKEKGETPAEKPKGKTAK